MARWHLFEFGDQRWFPRTLHQYATDYLAYVQSVGKRQLKSFVAPLERIREQTPGPFVGPFVDLCSGGAGPWTGLAAELVAADARPGKDANRPVVILTDLHPNLPALDRARTRGGGLIDYVAEPVDATRVPRELSGPRTIFNGFHHFRPDAARAVLTAAASQGQPIAVFEILTRNPLLLLTAPFIVLAVLALTPFIRPFRFGRLVWTYLVPVVPLTVLWDGVVSMLRVYSAAELAALTRDIEAPGYRWEIGTVRLGVVEVPYLLGLSSSP